ncbi:hypothetical protein Lser_V15G27921 [Lactuca serriola]
MLMIKKDIRLELAPLPTNTISHHHHRTPAATTIPLVIIFHRQEERDATATSYLHQFPSTNSSPSDSLAELNSSSSTGSEMINLLFMFLSTCLISSYPLVAPISNRKGNQKQIAHYTLHQIQPLVVSFEEQDIDKVKFCKGIKYVYVDDSMDDIGEIPILLEWNHEFQLCWNGMTNSNFVVITEVDA